MTLNENMKSAYTLRKEREAIEEEIQHLKDRIVEIDAELDTYNNGIMTSLKEQNKIEVELDGMFANLFRRENVGYTSDADVIAFLKSNGHTNFIKTKITETLDKNPLKKELKSNIKLAEELAPFIVKTLTEYVVVTDAENHAKMLEHIAESTK